GGLGFGDVFGRAVRSDEGVHQPLYDGLRGDVVLADSGIQRSDVGELKVTSEVEQRVPAHESLQREVRLAHRPTDRILAGLDRVLAALAGEPLPNLVAGSWRPDERQPVTARTGGLGLRGEHL